MMKRTLALGLCLGLMWAGAAAAWAAGPRNTPLVQAIQRAKASVVNIHSKKTARDSGDVLADGPGQKINGMGTGLVVDERGYLVTNFHVIDGVESLRVTLIDGSTYQARVISYDKQKDLAVIKIDAPDPLSVMPLGTSSDLMLGETVIAVGNAFGYEHTVTAGIISALSRDVEVNETQAYENLIQTDASINPGNSGGPLLNLEGEVVGINVAIRAGAQRIGFAIPIDHARRTIAELLSIEQLDGTYHGVLTRVEMLPEPKLVVRSARPDSPAAEAGLKSGDVILKADGTQIRDRVDFERALLGYSPGDAVELVVRRNDETKMLNLTLDRLEAGSRARHGKVVVRANNEKSPPLETAWKLLGVRLQRLPNGNTVLADSPYRGGLRVVEVRSGGPAAKHGIRQGDVLVGLHIWETVNRENVQYVLGHPDFDTFDPLKFYIVRGGETLYGHMQVSR